MFEEHPAKGTVVDGKYRIERVLGQGAMGVVLAATHLELGQEVAIKLLQSRHLEKSEAISRFLREARACVRIQSEHVVRVLDVGRLGSGLPYMVMEYLEGRDLAQILQERGPLPISLAVDYVLQACDAVAAAHHGGIIHRDLKPSNLFLARRSDGTEVIKVIDFGISKVRLADSPEGALTQGGLLGSPLYMSPEQMNMSQDIDARSDIWALGVILYELLSGQVPHPGDSYNAVIYHISTQPALPFGREGQEFPRDLVEVVNRALSLRPEDRLASAEALAEELTGFARRVVWPRVADGVAPRRDMRPSPEPDAHDLPGTSPGSTWDAGEPQRKSLGWRAPAVAAIGLAISLALLLSVRGLSRPRSEPDNNALRAVPSPFAAPPNGDLEAAPPIPSERASPAELTAPPAASSPEEHQATYRSLIGLEPTVMSEVIANRGRDPELLTFIRKARGTEAHKGGAPVVPGDDQDVCMTSWLSGRTNLTACGNALGLPQFPTIPGQ